MKRPIIRRLLKALLILTIFLVPNLSSALTYYVSNSGSNASDGLTPGTAFLTIQFAVNTANSGDTVRVAAGTYTENVTVNKSLTFLGAQAGVDARTRSGNPSGESVVNHPSRSFGLSGDNIILDGFIVEGAVQAPFRYGIWTNSNFSGYQIINNFIQDNIMGLYPNASGVIQNIIQFNVFRRNGVPGPAPHAIYTDQGSNNFLVDSNQFTNNASCGMNFVSFNNSLAQNLTITNNEIDSNTTGICLAGTLNVLIENNTITNGAARAMDFNGGNDGVTVQDNLMSGNALSAVRFRNLDNPPPFGTNTNIEFFSNQIIDNGAGFEIDPNSLTLPIDINFNRIFNNNLNIAGVAAGLLNLSSVVPNAVNNWWGCNEGPVAGSDCDLIGTYTFTPAPPTLTIIPDPSVAQFDPWLILRLLADPEIILTTENSELTADIIFNSDGLAPGGFVPNDTPAQFSANMGALNPVDALTLSGLVNSSFSSPNPGEDTICVTIDNETICVELQVNPGVIPTPTPASIFVEGSGCQLNTTAPIRGYGFLSIILGVLFLGILRAQPKFSK